SKPQAITVEGDRQTDGTLANVSITGGSSSDPNFRRVAEDFVASVNQSHALRFLEDVSHMRMTFTLDGERFRAETYSDAPTEQRPEELARGYRMLANFARLAKRGTDEGAVLNNMKISSSGKQLVMNHDMTRQQMGNILLRPFQTSGLETMIDKFLTKVFGSSNQRYLKTLQPLVAEVNELEAQVKKLTDEEMRARISELRGQVTRQIGDIPGRGEDTSKE